MLGGEPPVRRLVERFYEIMARDEPALARLPSAGLTFLVREGYSPTIFVTPSGVGSRSRGSHGRVAH